MNSEQARPLLYQADLRAAETLTSDEAAQLRDRRQLVVNQLKPSANKTWFKYSPLALSFGLITVLWFMPALDESKNLAVNLSGVEVNSLIDANSLSTQGKPDSTYDEDWVLYNDWAFYEWLAEEQLAEAY